MSLNNPPTRKPLRLWPGILAAALIVVARYVVPIVVPTLAIWGLLAGMAAAALFVIWWLLFSRAPWIERLGSIAVAALAMWGTILAVDPSMSGGLMGRLMYVYAFPATLPLTFVVWAVATRRASAAMRGATMVVAIAIGCGMWVLLRTDGVSGEGVSDIHWRWTPTAEQRLLTRADEKLPPENSTRQTLPAEAGSHESRKQALPADAGSKGEGLPADAGRHKSEQRPAPWPGFRGANRDGVVRGVHLQTDWSKTPPVEVWRRAIGPGWSSFAVAGDLIYTQEQRGDEEIVSCYRLATGEPVWRHRDAARFYESNGGPGPRGTPAHHGGRVYTLGATGIVNALDGLTGERIWTRNAAADSGAPMPGWGYTSSPLVVGDAVVVATSGRLVSYGIASGSPRWTHTTGGASYSSPHLVTIDGIAQIVLLTGNGATSVAPADGTRLWQHPWDIGTAIVQPGLAGDRDILMALGDAMGGQGMRRLAVSRATGAWTAEERWTTRGLKPYFNDFVVHKGFAYGFDGSILSAIGLADGVRKWKGGRYGHGQMLLIADQDVLLVLSEEGDLALVSAQPDKFTEITRFKVIEGKTWNHPVLVGDLLLVRNGEEMAAFRLAITDFDADGKY